MYIDDINVKLKDQFGHTDLGNAVFRIVWSNDQTEVVFGEHERWYGSIYLGKDKGVKRIKKYDFIVDRWVLERLFPNNPELSGIQSKYTYEPLFVFQNAESEYLEPNLRAAEMLCWMSLNPPRKRRDLEEEKRKMLEKETEFFLDYINEQSSFRHIQMKHGEGIVVP